MTLSSCWIYYNAENYTHHDDYHYSYNTALVESCSEFLPENDNQARSLRFAGDTKTLNRPAVNLYQYVNFAVLETILLGGISDVNFFFRETRSLIITGNSSWTFYVEPNYKGDNICMTPNSHVISGETSLDYRLAMYLEIGTVGSMKMGCDTRVNQLQ